MPDGRRPLALVHVRQHRAGQRRRPRRQPEHAHRSPAIDELFTDGADAALDALCQASLRQQARVKCREQRHFPWDVARLVAPDALVDFFALKADEDPRCLEVRIAGPEVARLPKNPADLHPVRRLVKDAR